MTDNLQDLRIPDNAFNDNDVKHLEDVPSMSAADLKAVFDYGAEKIVTPALNALIAFLASSKAAGALGITGIDGVSGTSIQGLLDGMKDLIDDRYTKEQSDQLLGLKLNQSTANGMVKDVKIDLTTGVIRVEKLDGSFEETDTALEKIAVNVEFDAEGEQLVLTLPDGSTQQVNISDFVKPNEFIDSDVIQWSVSGGDDVIATIKPESITTDLLAPALLADFVDKMQKAAESAANAKASEENAKTCLDQARNYMSETLDYRDEAKQSAYEAAIAKNNAKTSETNAAESAAAAAESAKKAGEIAGGDFATKTELSTHTGNKNNPHGVTAEQVGALPLTGGTMTGAIGYEEIKLLNGVRSSEDDYNNAFRLLTVGDEDYILLRENKLVLFHKGLVCDDLECGSFATSGSQIVLFPSGDKENNPAFMEYNRITDDLFGFIVTDPYNNKQLIGFATTAHKVTLTAAGWSSKALTVSVDGVLADETAQQILPMPTMDSMAAYNDAGIQCTGQAKGKLTFTCETVPTADIEVFVTITPVLFS